jgi:hypothetical protein
MSDEEHFSHASWPEVSYKPDDLSMSEAARRLEMSNHLSGPEKKAAVSSHA